MTNRQPKGIPVGGQFAEGRKPDGGDLATDQTWGFDEMKTAFDNSVAQILGDRMPSDETERDNLLISSYDSFVNSSYDSFFNGRARRVSEESIHKMAQGFVDDMRQTTIGATYGTLKIAEWSETDDDNAVIQSRSVESGTPSDFVRWSARGIAQVLKERGVKTAKVSDVLDVFNDNETVSVAFDPKQSVWRTVSEINATLEGLSR